MRRSLLFASVLSLTAVTVGFAVNRYAKTLTPLVTGKSIDPLGTHVDVASFPANMVLTPNGKFVIVTNTGFRQQISVLDASTGLIIDKDEYNKPAKKNLYYGLACLDQKDGTTLLAASCGQSDKVAIYTLSSEGKLGEPRFLTVKPPVKSNYPGFVSGVAFSSDGTKIAAALNQSHEGNNFHGSVAFLNLTDGTQTATVEVNGFPMGIVTIGDTYLVANEGGTGVSFIKEDGTRKDLETGVGPVAVITNADKTLAYVSNTNSDTVSVIDTAQQKVKKTLLLRPGALRGTPGVTPLGLALSRDEKRLFVAVGDLNAVALVDLTKGEVEGYLPGGWYPTSAVVSKDGSKLFVSNAKGTKVRNPNDKPVGEVGKYGPNIIEGTVATIDLNVELPKLKEHTQNTLETARALPNLVGTSKLAYGNPGIEHVVYVIKENRTYDQVLSDLPRGSRDPSLLMFGREVTPNLHALAERFVLLDNFYVCAEVSADGWNWSTSGMANAYTERNVFTNYGGHGRTYDYEGLINDRSVDLKGVRDPATAPGGYLWDRAAKDGVSFRNYGFFVDYNANMYPTKKALEGKTNLDFRHYDMAYADSEAWVKYGLSPAPKQLKASGSYGDPSRMTVWLREYRNFVKSGKMPNLMMVRLGRDHTSGTADGQYSPRACVADNDYAVGQLVQEISNGPYWNKTAICVLEDDAQAGFDHVDCHRSTAYIISPYIQKGTLNSTFYNTDSMLRTIELLLGMKPMNSYDAIASPIQVFSRKLANSEPYMAILPAKEIVGEINTKNAYRSKDSERLISRFKEETYADIELNDILWGAIKGAHTPKPSRTNAKWQTKLSRKDDDD